MKGLLAALLSLLLVAGCTSGTGQTPQGSGQGYPTVKKNLTQIPPGERQVVKVLTGKQLGTDKQLSSADFPGKVVVINVWGSWCPPCQAEAKDLQSAHEQTAEISQFIGLTTKDADEAAPLAFNRSFGITYPSVFDPTGRALLTYAGYVPPSAIPSTLIIDADGRLAVRIHGPITATTLVTMINDVAEGR